MASKRFQDLTERILPTIAQSGQLGSGVKFEKCVFDETSKGQAQFASSTCFVIAHFKNENDELKVPLVIKYNMSDELVREWLKLDFQFRNEVVIYQKVLPFLNRKNEILEMFPRCFYGSADENEEPNNYVIVLEDLRSSGYRLTSEVLNLDFAHCALAFKKLGAFHALSFIAKETNPKGFYDTVQKIVETTMFEDKGDEWNYLYTSSLHRASEPLIQKGEKIEEIEKFKNNLKDSVNYFKKLRSVEEPMGVIIHGDFCRNNVLYRYNNENPVDMKFFDLATSRYGSPMLDFVFFFFLNNSEESRKLYRDEYLKIYYDSLSSAAKDVKIPSLEEFKCEFFQKAVYGFLLCSFFKPAMMDPEPFNPVIQARWNNEQRMAKVTNNGGVKGTEVISNMLSELIESKCVL